MDDKETIDSAMALAVLDEQADATIRRAEIDGVWYFSVIDVIAILTDSAAPRQYWMDTKKRMRTSDGWKETSENLLQLPLLAADGKPRPTDCANTETLLRIIQSVPSPKAEPIKQWLAKIGAQHLETREQVTVPAPTTPIAQAWTTDRPTDHQTATCLAGQSSWSEWRLSIASRQVWRVGFAISRRPSRSKSAG